MHHTVGCSRNLVIKPYSRAREVSKEIGGETIEHWWLGGHAEEGWMLGQVERGRRAI